MEPSLRSSSYRPTDCKLRRTDPALHETIQRFVESQHTDVRISQYADLAYASKKLAMGKWYWLNPIEGGRAGYLVFTPESPVVWIDEQFKQSFRIPMRVDKSMYEKTTVLIASLNKTEGILRLEDAWMVAGKSYFDLPFSKRWEELLRFYRNFYKVDSYLQQGLVIEPATYTPLADALTWNEKPEKPELMFAQGDTFPRRLRVQVTPREDKSTLHAKELAKQLMEKNDRLAQPASHGGLAAIKRSPVTPFSSSASSTSASTSAASSTNEIVYAIPHEEYPDTYTIMIGGKPKGYAAIQDIALSQQLRSASASSAAEEDVKLRVKVEWNSEFSMYEIISLL